MKKKTTKNKLLKRAPAKKEFVLVDGKVLKDVFQLIDALEKMGDDVFNHHVNEARNDFSNWIRDVFDDHELADMLSQPMDKMKAELVILRRVVDKLKKG